MIFTITTKDSQHMLLLHHRRLRTFKRYQSGSFSGIIQSERKTGLFQTWQIESTGDESDIQQMYGLL